MARIAVWFKLLMVVFWLGQGVAFAEDVWLPSGGPFGGNVRAFAVAPDGTLYAGTKGGGVFRSADKGATWTAASSGLTNKDVQALVLAPDGTLYAGTNGGGVFMSTDKAATWTAASNGLSNTVVQDLAFAPDSTLYAGTNGGIFRSTDKGASWTAASNGLTHTYVLALALALDGTLYAGTNGGGVFMSTDKGATWTAASNGFSQVWALALTPDGTLYAGTGSAFGNGGVFRSTDKGATWIALSNRTVQSLALATDGTLYAGTGSPFGGGGVIRSEDKGATWTATSSGLSSTPVLALVIAPDGTLYAGTGEQGDGGIYRSLNKGATWTAASNGVINTNVLALALAPDGALYVGTDGGGVFMSTDKAATWATASNGLTNMYGRALAFALDGTLYAGTNGGVFRSADKGATWTAASGGLTYTVNALGLAPDGTLYAGMLNGVYKSADKGTTWTVASSGLTNKDVQALALAPDGTLYAGTSGGVFRSADKGATWTVASSGLTNAKVLALALTPDGTLYAGMEDGVFKSADKGTTWTAASSGLVNAYILTLALAPDGSLYAGTHGGGVQRLPLTAPAKLTSLTLQAPTELPENTSATVTAIAGYDLGSKKTVIPTWSVDNAAVASINASGLLTALAVDKDTPVTVSASYSENGLTQTATRTLVVKNIPAPLADITLAGPATLNSGATASYAATARYSDGKTSPVNAAWSVSGPAKIDSYGVLSAQSVSADTPVTLTARYAEGSIAKTATLAVTITKPASPLKFLWIEGPAEVEGGQMANYTATAVYEDGNKKPVIPVWTVNDATPGHAFADMTKDGKLTAAKPLSKVAVQIVANYSEGSVAQAAQKTIDILPCAASQNSASVKIDGITLKSFGDPLHVSYNLCNFNVATRFDVYLAVQLPDGRLMFGIKGQNYFTPIQWVLYDNQTPPPPFLRDTLLPDQIIPVVDIGTMPMTMPTGTYTVYAIPVLTGSDVFVGFNWVGSLATQKFNLMK